MATGNIDPTFAGTVIRNTAGGVWGGAEVIPGQSSLPSQDFRRGLYVANYDFAGVDDSVDEETGLIRLNAHNPLPDNVLIVGGFVRVTTQTVCSTATANQGLYIAAAGTAFASVTGGVMIALADGVIETTGNKQIIPVPQDVTKYVEVNGSSYDQFLMFKTAVTSGGAANAVTAGSFLVILDLIKIG